MSALRQSLQVFVDRELSPEAQSARLADAARATLADLLASGRASPRYTKYADGQEGADESTARKVVLYAFDYLGDAVTAALAYLRDRSLPAVSGKYRNSFVVAVNGRPVSAASFQPDSVPPGAEVLIYNPAPYSRKLDVQLSGTRPLAYRTEAGLFDDAVSFVRRRFGNAVAARRLYTVRFPGQYQIRRGRDAGRLTDSPALVLTARG